MRIPPRSSCVPYVVFEHSNHLLTAQENNTRTPTQVRNTERVFKNKAAEKVLEIEREHPGDFSKIAHLVRGENYREVFHETGELDEGVECRNARGCDWWRRR